MVRESMHLDKNNNLISPVQISLAVFAPDPNHQGAGQVFQMF